MTMTLCTLISSNTFPSLLSCTYTFLVLETTLLKQCFIAPSGSVKVHTLKPPEHLLWQKHAKTKFVGPNNPLICTPLSGVGFPQIFVCVQYVFTCLAVTYIYRFSSYTINKHIFIYIVYNTWKICSGV